MVISAAAKPDQRGATSGRTKSDSVRYVTLSSYVRQKPAGTRKKELEQRLRAQYGVDKIESPKLQHPQAARSNKHACETIPPCVTAIQTLSKESSILRASAIDVIVIDQEAELPLNLISATCQHLKSLLVSGIDVGIFFSDSSLVLLKDLSRLTTSDEFIRIYLKEIWKPQ